MANISKSVVAISRCDSYQDDQKIYQALQQTLSLLGNMSDLLGKGKKVLIKPNLLDHLKSPEHAINTHPSLVKAIAKYLIDEHECKVYIGESTGANYYGKTKLAFKNSQYIDFAAELGVELIDFDRCESFIVKNNSMKVITNYSVAKIIKEIDCLISVPKLKTHDLLDYTGALKNLVGLVQGSGKRDLHIVAPRKDKMAHCVVDNFQTTPIHLSIMDAIIAMEGNGPAGGDPREAGLIIASRDSVALDTVASYIIGFKPRDVLTTKIAYERGLGEADMKNITIQGESIEKALVPDFKKPFRTNFANYNFLPDSLVRLLWQGQTAGKPFIVQNKCQKCQLCLKGCPVNTIYEKNS